MGCSPQVYLETQITAIESERWQLSSQYSSNSMHEPFQFKIRFSQGICISDMKKYSETIYKPCQSTEEDPIFYEDFQIDSSSINESINQSHQSKGILISQKNLIIQQKKVTFEQNQLSRYYLDASQKNKVKKQKKSRKSIYVL